MAQGLTRGVCLVYAVAAVFILAFCFGSDFARERGHFLTGTATIACVSFIIVVSVNDLHVKCKVSTTQSLNSVLTLIQPDGFLCLAVGGVYAACPLTLMWVANSIPHPSEKRASQSIS